MKNIICSFVLFVTILGFGQKPDQNQVSIDLNLGSYITQTSNTYSFNAPSTGLAGIGGIGIQFNPFDKIGNKISISDFDYEVGNNELLNKVKMQQLSIGLSFDLVAKKHFSLWIGANIGRTKMTIWGIETDSLNNTNNLNILAKGISQELYIKPIFLFGKNKSIGFYIELGLLNAPNRWIEYKYNDILVEQVQSLKINEIVTNQLGTYLKLGLSFQFGAKN